MDCSYAELQHKLWTWHLLKNKNNFFSNNVFKTFSHWSSVCRSQQQCSAGCRASRGVRECQEDKPKCLFCQGEHLLTNISKCPEFEIQKRAKELMIFRTLNISTTKSLQVPELMIFYEEINKGCVISYNEIWMNYLMRKLLYTKNTTNLIFITKTEDKVQAFKTLLSIQ